MNLKKYLTLILICFTFNSFAAEQKNITQQDIINFFDAAQEGNLKKLQQLLDKGIDPNIKDQNEWSVLLKLTIINKATADIIDMLAKYGANINATTKAGYTPLYMAIEQENLPIIKSLIKNGANVNAKTDANTSILYRAVIPTENQAPNKEIIKVLLLNGANYNDPKLNMLNSPINKDKKEIFQQAKKEIIDEYRDKLHNLINLNLIRADEQHQILPNVLLNLIAEYVNYPDDEILSNIIEIRKLLGELSQPIQQKDFNEQRLEGGAAAL